mgnify:CR=1 FL=1
MAGHVIVEDMAHIRDIQPTRRHIRGHKKTQGARSKIIQSFRTLRLIQIAMNWRGIKAVFLVLTLVGMGTMWMAVFADAGASLLVVGNGLRLLRK